MLPVCCADEIARRHPDGGSIVRDIGDNDGIGADAAAGADGDRADDLGAGADEDVVPEDGRLGALGPDGYLVLDFDVRATAHGSVDDHSVAMDENESGAEIRAAAD